MTAHGPDATAAMRSGDRILLAEDDEMLTKFLEGLLSAEGYVVDCVSTGPAVLAQLDPGTQLLVLDLNLPGLDGLSVLHRLRPLFPKLSIIVLTARGREDGLLPALNSGADDCLLKPFSYVELLARIRVLLRRSGFRIESAARCADLLLNREHKVVMRGDRRIELTPKEFKLLEFLMRTPDVPVSRDVLLKEVWDAPGHSSTNVVDVYMKYVRDKVDVPGCSKLVRTVRGSGYMLSAV